MISGYGEEENTEYLPIKLKKQTDFDQNNNPIQKVKFWNSQKTDKIHQISNNFKLNMLKKSKTVSFQSPIVQDNETSDRILKFLIALERHHLTR